jgi:hypothetical protein
MNLELFDKLVRQSAALQEKIVCTRERWTDDDVSKLTAMWDDGVWSEAFRRCSFKNRDERSGLAPKREGTKTGAGNWICHHCKNSDEFNGRAAA